MADDSEILRGVVFTNAAMVFINDDIQKIAVNPKNCLTLFVKFDRLISVLKSCRKKGGAQMMSERITRSYIFNLSAPSGKVN